MKIRKLMNTFSYMLYVIVWSLHFKFSDLDLSFIYILRKRHEDNNII